MPNIESSWGDASGKLREEVSLFHRHSGAHMEGLLIFEKGSFQARSLNQYLDILTHNGAPNVFENAQTIVDAGCGGMTALADIREAYGPERSLYGFDVLNIPRVTIRLKNGHTLLASALIKQFDLRFIQGTYSELPTLIPESYDALVAIPLFYSQDWVTSYPLDIYERMYGGLRPGGFVQTILGVPKGSEEHVFNGLTLRNLPFQFTPADLEVLKHHALYDSTDPDTMGTLTIGPK